MNAPTPAPTAPWYKRTVLSIPVWVIGLVAGIALAIGVATITKPDEEPAAPTTTVDACTALADPANANLHPSDWRRIGGWTQSEMVTYVTAHCPAQLDKVTS